jgi:DNA modification methylase
LTEWPADAVERRPVSSLTPYARNARTHSDAQVAQIAASIREWGWTVPVLVDETGMLIAGHGRVLAAQRLGVPEVPVMVARGWSEAQKRAYVLADNKLALNAGWDSDLLRVELSDLQEGGFDLGLAGFEATELEALLAEANPGLTDPDDSPEPPVYPVSELGDVWLLGRHRIVCGDSTDALAVEAALAGVKPHLMVTDPPYGVEYDAAWRNEAAAEGKIGQRGQSRATGKVENDDRAEWAEAWALFPGDVAYVWCASLHAHVVAGSLIASGFGLKSQIIWAKDRFQLSRGHYHWQHEPCWYATRGAAHWNGDRKQSSLWEIKLPWDNYGNRKPGPEDVKNRHSTQKPVECMKRPIENNSSPGQAVYEPFSGSGTTLIACEMTGRVCHAIELSPAYVDVAVKRWSEFTGHQATLEGDGRTFAEVEGERQPQADAA